jgi:hypothetical protein
MISNKNDMRVPVLDELDSFISILFAFKYIIFAFKITPIEDDNDDVIFSVMKGKSSITKSYYVLFLLDLVCTFYLQYQ